MSLSRAAAARMANKTIFITGASSGIGRSVALEFARAAPAGPRAGEEVRLVLAARRKDRLDEVAAEIKAMGAACGSAVPKPPVLVHTLKLDIEHSTQADLEACVRGLPGRFREIDVLVNNAGLVKGVARSPEIAAADIDTMLATNVRGLIGMTQAVLPGLLGRDGGRGRGDIVNIGSIAGREGYPGGSVYCATKAAVRAYTDALRKELVASRVRVIEVDPGQVETEFSVVRFGGDRAEAAKVYEGVDPLTPDDIAEIVVFACSRPENVVLADTLVFPNHQASATTMHRRPTGSQPE